MEHIAVYIAYAAGIVTGSAATLYAIAMAFVTPKEIMQIIKEERFEHGRKLRSDKRSRNHREN